MMTADWVMQPPLPQGIWRTWNWDPLLIGGLLLVGTLYARGILRLWQRTGTGRVVNYLQVSCFVAGWLALAVALVSPVDAMGSALLSAHMVQHLLLTLVAAPLLVVGLPPVVLGWGVPRSPAVARWWHRRTLMQRVWHFFSRPIVAWATHLFILWVWHAPPLYEAALLNEAVHILEHLTFLGSALIFWWTVLPRRASRRDLSMGSGALYIFTTALLSGLLGVLLTFSEDVWYPAYGILPYGWGLTPLQDQQLAGVIMWFPGGLVYLAAALLLLGTALQRRSEKEGSGGVVVAPARPLKVQS
jgi:putative membrane protein